MPIFVRTRSRSQSCSQMFSPSMRMWPPVGCSSRLTQRSSVDLPEPDGPITHTTSPEAMARSMPLQDVQVAEALLQRHELDRRLRLVRQRTARFCRRSSQATARVNGSVIAR